MKLFQKITFLVSAFIILACGKQKSNTETDTTAVSAKQNNEIQLSKAQFKSNGMQLGRLSQKPFPSVVNTTGMIDVPPQNRALISSYISGYVKNTPLLIGDKIVKGQALVTLENPEFIEMQQNYLETAQQLNFLKAEYQRQKTLIEEKISSQKKFLKAETDYKSVLAHYNGLKKKLQMLNINISKVEAGNISSTITLFAPIHGYVTKLNVSKGTYVSPSDEIMEIINTDHVHLELSVFEKDVLKIKEGQKIQFKIPEADDEYYEAEVHLVGTSIDLKNRTVKVHGHLLNDENHGFAVGMFVDARIITKSTEELALPENAIVSMDDSHYVLVNTAAGDSYDFMQKEVVLGDNFNGYTMIKNIEDFDMNDNFLVKGAFNLIGETE